MIPNKRNIPRNICIKDNIWTVVFKNKIIEHNIECDGLCDPSTYTIYIRTKQSKTETFATFLHELFHAIEFEYDFQMKHSHIYKLEYAMVNLIKDNFMDQD